MSVGFLPGSHPDALAWLTARGRQGAAQPGWQPCPHAPTAWVTEPTTTRIDRCAHPTTPGSPTAHVTVSREVIEEGATYCQICSGEHADLVLRWLAHGPLTTWALAVELGWERPAAIRVLRVLRDVGLVVAEPTDGFGEPALAMWRAA